MSEIFKDWKDLDIDKVDFDKVDFEDGSGWTWGMMSQGNYRIIHLENLPDHDLQETIYPVPACIGYMLDLKEKWGKQELQRDCAHFFHSVLGIK